MANRLTANTVAHLFGQMTYGRAPAQMREAKGANAAISHGLTSSPPKGEGTLAHAIFRTSTNWHAIAAAAAMAGDTRCVRPR